MNPNHARLSPWLLVVATCLAAACSRAPVGCQSVRFDDAGQVSFRKAAIELVEEAVPPRWGRHYAMFMTLMPDVFRGDPQLATASRYLIEPDILNGRPARCRGNQLGPGIQCFSNIPGTRLLVVVTFPTEDISATAAAVHGAQRISDEVICR